MPDSEKPNETPNSNGQTQPEPKLTLREVAEAAWDEVVEDAPDEDETTDDSQAAAAPLDEGGQPRDKQGRFVSRETPPGEADGEEPTQPRPEVTAPQPQESPTQPRQGEADEAPANWSAEHRAMFAKLPAEAKAFVSERVHATESDYQRKVQAAAPATQFVSQVAPVFNDPTVAASLQHFGLSPSQAIQEWGAVHKRMFGPDLRDRYLLLNQLAQQMGISLNPAAAASSQPVGQRPSGLTQEELANPAINWFADNVSQTSSAVAQLTQRLQNMEHSAAQRQYDEAFQRVQWGIANYAEEKDANGQKLRPYFDDPEVAQVMVDLFKANPNRDLADTYERAKYMIPRVREAIAAGEAAKVKAKADAQRAAQAARSNVRGVTSPVATPNGAVAPRTLRETLEASADEVGLE